MTFVLNMIGLIPSSGFISWNHMALAMVVVIIGKVIMKMKAPLIKNKLGIN